jgi:pyridoxamine 5'-phosphate oxidase
LVFRRWINGDQLDLFSDQRSDKIDELNHQRHVELCWLLPKARQQFRLRGSISSFTTTTEPELCRTAWLSLTPQGRAVWSWPHPGQPFQADADFPEDVDDSMPMPDHFIVLRLKLDQVEQLDLKPHPHRRVRWCAADNWSEQRLNP